MEIIIKQQEELAKGKVVFEVNEVTPTVLRAIQILSSPEDLTVYQDNQIFLLKAADVFYIETVDTKTYVYTKDQVYVSRLKVSEIESTTGKDYFLRANKQTLINQRRIKSVAPAGGGRFQAVFTNNDKIIISRQYVPLIKAHYRV